MDICRLLLVLSPLLIVYATAEQSPSDCMVPVTDVSSVFGQSDVATPPLTEFAVSDYLECNEKCCQQENCNVVTFNESSSDGENNCLLFACHPTTTCNFIEQDGVLIFVDTDTAAFSTPNSSTASTTMNTIAAENATTNSLTSSTTLTTTSLPSSNNTLALSSTTFATLNPSSETPPTTTATTTTTLDNNNSTEPVGITVTPTLSSVTTTENITTQSNNVSTIEPSQTSGTDSFSTTQSSNVTLAFSNMVAENATTMTVTPSSSQSTVTSTSAVQVTTSSLPTLQSSTFTSVGTVSSQTLQVTENTATTENVGSTITIQPTAATTTMTTTTITTTTDQMATVMTTTDSSQQGTSVTQPTDTFPVTTVKHITASIGFNETYNATNFQDAAAGVETAEAMTAILICALTFGCVFLLAVIGVLGKRIYEGYKKRHYSRLDYLINGMYN